MDKIGKYKVEKIISNKKYVKIFVCSKEGEDELFKIRAISSDMPNLQDFLNEAKYLNELEIDKVPKFFEKFEDDENIYFVYEFIKGISLEKYLDINGYISESRAMEMLLEISEILNQIYEKTDRKMVHRGIKADNIIIDLDGNINIIDFHLNRIYDTSIKQNEADIGPDLFGMGITMLYALTGYNILATQKDLSIPKLCDKGISRDFERIVEKLMNRDYKSYAELKNELNYKKNETENIFVKIAVGVGAIAIIALIIYFIS